jgi:hypothetical protein
MYPSAYCLISPLNPQPSTLNPQPAIRNPQPRRCLLATRLRASMGYPRRDGPCKESLRPSQVPSRNETYQTYPSHLTLCPDPGPDQRQNPNPNPTLTPNLEQALLRATQTCTNVDKHADPDPEPRTGPPDSLVRVGVHRRESDEIVEATLTRTKARITMPKPGTLVVAGAPQAPQPGANSPLPLNARPQENSVPRGLPPPPASPHGKVSWHVQVADGQDRPLLLS